MSLDKEKARKKIKSVLDKMNDADALQLHEYYELYKKEVPFFKRSWAAAWLFMNYDTAFQPPGLSGHLVKKEKEKENGNGNAGTNETVEGKEAGDASDKSAVVIIPEEESKRLFISVGKSRRLFPREIISLLMSNTSTAREDIGVIRILDNYSFVQVRDTKADEIIEKLSGFKFRGRILTINYAKPKTQEEQE